MFFILSKVLLILIRPLFWILVLLFWALITKNAKRKKVAIWMAIVVAFLCSNKVVVNEVAMLWEPRENTVQILPKTAIVLGGFSKFDTYRNQITISEAGERLFKIVELFKTHQIDTIVISGGAASLTGQIRPESVYAREYMVSLGIPANRIWVDSTSKNTFENAQNSRDVLQKLHHTGKVLLITSGFHMKRAQHTFIKSGLDVVPFSVQFISSPSRGYIVGDYIVPSSEALFHFDVLLKEWVGYWVYRITGKA